MMPTEDLDRVIRDALQRELPFAEVGAIDTLTRVLVARILARDAELAAAYAAPVSRVDLAERLDLERHQPVPRRGELPASLANLDTPEVIAKRLVALAEIPADSPEDPL